MQIDIDIYAGKRWVRAFKGDVGFPMRKLMEQRAENPKGVPLLGSAMVDGGVDRIEENETGGCAEEDQK